MKFLVAYSSIKTKAPARVSTRIGYATKAIAAFSTALLAMFHPQMALANSARITLAEYLDQVSGNSPGIAAARLQSEGGRRRADGASILSFPYLFGSASTFHDKSETLFPLQQGTETKGNNFSLGMGMNTTYGLSGKYTWNTAFSETMGVPLATSGKYTSYNKVDLTMSLVRNGFGSEARARKELIRAGNEAQSYAGYYQQVGKFSEAEATYWRLAFARQNVQIQKDILARAEKLLDWAKRRVSLQLGDRSDLLQAQASYDIHNLDLSNAVEEELSAARAFNLLRNETSNRVPEAVGLPSLEETLKMEAPGKSGDRLDIQSAAEKTKAVQAQAQIDKENLKPNVDIIAAYAWNGRESARSPAISEALTDKHPSQSIAITFSMPLNAPTWTSAIHGANQEIEAADKELDQLRLNELREWNDLSARFEQLRTRLKLAGTIENVQKEKFENERQRLQRGRTTTFQALTFEQDYASAQLLRLRTQAEILQTIAQMKTFRGKP